MATIDDVYNKVDALTTQVAQFRTWVEGMLSETILAQIVAVLNKEESNRVEIVGDINQSKTDIYDLVNSQSDLVREHVTSRCTNTTNAVNGHTNQVKADIFEELTNQIGTDAGGRTLHQHISEEGTQTTGLVNAHVDDQTSSIKGGLSIMQSFTSVNQTLRQIEGDILNNMVSNKNEIAEKIGTDSSGRSIHTHIDDATTTVNGNVTGQAVGIHNHINTVVDNQAAQTNFIGNVRTEITTKVDGAKDSVLAATDGLQTDLGNIETKVDDTKESVLAATNGLQTSLNNAKGSIEEKIANQHAQTRNNLEAKMQMCLEASNLNTSDVAESTKGTILNTVVGNLQSAKGEIMGGIGSARNAIESTISSAVGTHSEAGQPQTLHQHIESSKEILRTDIEDVSSEIGVVRSAVIDGNNLVADKVDGGVSTIRQEATTNKEMILTAVQSSDATIQQKIESGKTSILGVLSDVNDNVNQKASAITNAVTSQIQLSAQDIINAITGVDPSMLLEVIQQSLNAVMRNEMIKDDTERALVGALVIALVRTQLGDKKFEELTNVLERVKYAPASAVEQGMMVGEPVDSPLSVYYQLFNSTKKKPTPNRLSPEFGDANSKE